MPDRAVCLYPESQPDFAQDSSPRKAKVCPSFLCHVGKLMQLEIAARLRVGAIALGQAVGLGLGHARNLRLIRVERRQRLGGRTFTRHPAELADQLAYLRQRFALTHLAAVSPHAFGEVEPQLAV